MRHIQSGSHVHQAGGERYYDSSVTGYSSVRAASTDNCFGFIVTGVKSRRASAMQWTLMAPNGVRAPDVVARPSSPWW